MFFLLKTIQYVEKIVTSLSDISFHGHGGCCRPDGKSCTGVLYLIDNPCCPSAISGIQAILNKIKTEWDFEKEVDETFLKKGITYYLTLRQIAEENRLNAISIKDVDGMKKILDFPPAMIFMLLSDEMHVCTIPENDAMGAVTQLIVKELTGQCAAYLEFYEFSEESVLLGVPDFVPAEVVDGKVKVTAAAFGGIPGGLLNISTLKTGKLTLAR